ncbi:aryl-alcohol-oxidase from pleurotus Eryingii [Pholiota conissans]|uniref:pyranose dehydrogenase (acceptor) n=1 Tax=Pholiota conissans TaxID=109636 RepID=A0A9P5YU95_9AGAR|nr:aryl-alcohol-oxidase from pleurotus Eryingii [Pholiota conissans]
MLRSLFITFLLNLLIRPSFSRLLTDPSQLLKEGYDFVIVGAGNAGNVIANRLASVPAFTVLVIEAGVKLFVSDAGIVSTQIPFIAPNILLNTSLTWDYVTVPQEGLNSRILTYQRGKLLGGSSSINFLIFTRGSRDDFDRWANVTGDSIWEWDAMFPFALKARFTTPVDNHNTSQEIVPNFHNTKGPLLTTVNGFPSSIDGKLVATTQADSEEFPFNPDTNSGNPIGMSWIQSTSGGGSRSSSATAYLHPILSHPNLDVLVETQVTRLINIAEKGGKPDLREVEFAKNATSHRFTIRAKNEVILSAGAVNTPQLLLLSGVGPKSELAKFKIPLVVDSPGVGQNLQDHPLLAQQFLVNSNETLDDISRNATLAADVEEQWITSKTGPFVDVAGNLFSWVRVGSDIVNKSNDPSAGPTSAHVELFPNEFVSFSEAVPATGSFISVVNGLVSPASRGSITLNSSDPFDFPVIDPGFLKNPLDGRILIESVKLAQKMINTSPWDGFVIQPFGALANATTDAEILEFVRNTVTSFWHPTGTAKMGEQNDPMAVVDSKLFLKGVQGVRVIDTSIFPFIPAAHLQAPTYAVAERGASLIQETWAKA